MHEETKRLLVFCNDLKWGRARAYLADARPLRLSQRRGSAEPKMMPVSPIRVRSEPLMCGWRAAILAIIHPGARAADAEPHRGTSGACS